MPNTSNNKNQDSDEDDTQSGRFERFNGNIVIGSTSERINVNVLLIMMTMSDEDGYQFNDKQSQSVHSKYRGNHEKSEHISSLSDCLMKPVVVVFIDHYINQLNNDLEGLIKLR